MSLHVAHKIPVKLLHALACAQTSSLAYVHACTHPPTPTPTPTHPYTHTHTPTPTHPHTHTHTPGITCHALEAPSVQWQPGGGVRDRMISTTPRGGTWMVSHCTRNALFPVSLLNGSAAGAEEEDHPASFEKFSCQQVGSKGVLDRASVITVPSTK